MTIIADRPEAPVPLHRGGLDVGGGASTARTSRGGRRKSVPRRIFSEGGIIWILCCSAYLVVGVLLDFHYESFNGDATSRLANGFYVLYSRDPHLAAIGFVWNPGTSIADLVPLLFYHLWTPLASHAFAASLVSAFCMAGMVYQARCTLAEWGVARAARLVLVAILALNAMIVYYGGVGMSEGLYLFTLVATCRYLLRWMRDDDLASLVYSAIALGLCYIARNEAVGPAFAAGAVVLAVSFGRRSASNSLRSSVARSARIWGAVTDLVIFEIPFFFSFVGWAVVSYVITGQPFQQFTSVYGTSSQLKVTGQQGPPELLHARILHDVHDILYLAPAIVVIIILSILVAIRRRDVGVLAPLSVVGGGLAFDALAFITNSIAQWFRYFIAAVPLEVLLVGGIFATAPAVILSVRSNRREPSRAHRRIAGALAVVISLALLVPSAFTTIMGMSNPKVGYEETQNLGFIFSKHLSKADEQAPSMYFSEVKTTTYLEQMHLGNGQVIVDNFTGCVPAMILMSRNPQLFVIPNDRDYQRILADPLTFHAHYILEGDPLGDFTLTTVNILYPALWKTGAGFAREVHSFPAVGQCPQFKLFRVTRHPNLAG